MNSQALPEWAVKIKTLRKLMGETQEKFGKRFNVSQVAVAHWESGRSEPPAEVLMIAMRGTA